MATPLSFLVSKDHMLEFTVPAKCVGRIIGKNGSNINSIRQTTNTRICFVDLVPKDDKKQLCQISGASTADIEAAKAEIIKQLELEPTSSLKLEFEIPIKFISGIIGKEGVNIRYIQDRTHTRISFFDIVPKNKEYQMCQILGNTELDIQNARAKIEECNTAKLEKASKTRKKHDGKTHRHNGQ